MRIYGQLIVLFLYDRNCEMFIYDYLIVNLEERIN